MTEDTHGLAYDRIDLVILQNVVVVFVVFHVSSINSFSKSGVAEIGHFD